MLKPRARPRCMRRTRGLGLDPDMMHVPRSRGAQSWPPGTPGDAAVPSLPCAVPEPRRPGAGGAHGAGTRGGLES